MTPQTLLYYGDLRRPLNEPSPLILPLGNVELECGTKDLPLIVCFILLPLLKSLRLRYTTYDILNAAFVVPTELSLTVNRYRQNWRASF